MILDERGQAAAEYAVLASALVVAGAAVGWPYLKLLLTAWQAHVGLVFTLLEAPFP